MVKLEEDQELEELRRRKLEEYQRRIEEAYIREQQKKELEERKAQILRKILTPEARSRMETLKLVKKDLVEQLEAQLIQLALNGRIKAPITDEQLKAMLKSLQQPSETKIRIIRRE